MKIFYRDAVENITISWEEFVQDINNSDDFPKYVYTDSFYNIFKFYVLNVLNETELVLLDKSFSSTEVEKLTEQSLHAILSQKNKNLFKGKLENTTRLFEVLQSKENAFFALYTSGTTGKPKAVKHPLANLKRSVIVSKDKANNIWGFAYHPTHIAGVQVFLQALYNKNTIVRLFGVDIKLIEAELNRFQVTHISATPTFYRLFSATTHQFPNVKRITSGGEQFDTKLSERLKKIFPNAKIRNIYASTEFGALFVSDNDVFEVKTQYLNLVKIIDGELFVHKSLLGYFNHNIQVNTEWYSTGDLVEVVNHNPLRLKFIGRKSEMINVGGMKVNPSEIEEAIYNLFDEVDYVRVYGRKSSVVGSIVCCDLVTRDSTLSEYKIRKELREHLQSYKIPRLIRFFDQIELARTGKAKHYE